MEDMKLEEIYWITTTLAKSKTHWITEVNPIALPSVSFLMAAAISPVLNGDCRGTQIPHSIKFMRILDSDHSSANSHTRISLPMNNVFFSIPVKHFRSFTLLKNIGFVCSMFVSFNISIVVGKLSESIGF